MESDGEAEGVLRLGGAEGPRVGGKRWLETREIEVDGGWAHQNVGVRAARRGPGLAHGFKTNQSNCTVKGILRWRIARQ